MRFVPLVLLLSAGPVVGQATQLTPEALARIKGTTCYIKVKAGNGGGSGSGFLVRKDDKFGWVATNNHVIAPTAGRNGAGPPLPVQSIQVVFHSGTGKEWRAFGEVVARDPLRDLAAVKFAIPKGEKLAEPVALPGVKASETMPVYICGFPFGEMLAEGDKNPEVSIGPSSVSSVRTDDRGDVHRVQINGALNPGNSGGPVHNSDGKLVGVAVTTILGAGIGHAVPQHHVKEMMDGRMSEIVLVRRGNGVVALSVVVDPLGKVKPGKAWIAPTTNDGKKTVASVKELKGAQSFALLPLPGATNRGLLYSELALGPAVTEAWVQATWTDAEGNPGKGRPYRMRVRNPPGVGGPAMPTDPPGDPDDDGPGSLPPDFFNGVPGVPSTPAPPAPGPPGFAGPGRRPGPGPGLNDGGEAGPGGRPLNPNPGVPDPGGRVPNPGRGPKRGDPRRPDLSPTPPDAPADPSAPLEAETEARSLSLLDRIAANPSRANGGKYKLWLTVSGLEVGRLVAQRPDGTPLAGLRVQVDLGLAGTVRADLKKLGRGGHKGLVSFEVKGYDAAEKVAIGHATAVVLGGDGPAPGVPAEEEEEGPNGLAPPRADPSQPVLSAPATDAPPRPPVAVAEDGVSSRVIVLAGVLMLVAVVGLVGVGLAVMHAGKSAKSKGKKKRSRDWDDEDEDDDDRPRRRRR